MARADGIMAGKCGTAVEGSILDQRRGGRATDMLSKTFTNFIESEKAGALVLCPVLTFDESLHKATLSP